jgi:glycosyltransferase involved in cell wall biosynthesis
MSDRRRFAFVSPNFHPRVCGVGDHSARFADELRRRGHDVRIFSRTPVEQHPEVGDLIIHGAPGRLPIQVALDISNAIREYRPTDVVLQYTSQMWNTWRFGSAALVLLAANARRTGARISVIAHELYVPWRIRPDQSLAAFLQRVQLVGLLRQTDRFFVTTATRIADAAGFCRLLHLPEPKLTRIGPNALPLQRGTHPASNGASSGPHIGFFSTMARGKRFDVVIEAFERIARALPSAELVIMGDLGSPDRPDVIRIKREISKHSAGDRIRLMGKLSLSRIASEMAGLDLYLFPMDTGANTRSGTLPVALGSGVPVVTIRGRETDAALFLPDENVVFADDLTAPAFAKASLRLLRNPELLARVAEGARRLYEEHLSWGRIADRFLADLGANV